MQASRRFYPSIGNAIGRLVDKHYRDRANLYRIRDLGQLVALTAALIHELQRERGLSSGLVAGGRSFLGELEEQTLASEECELRALDCWAALTQDGSGLEAALAEARNHLAELPRLRGDIRALALTPNAVVQRFSALIDRLLVVVAEAPGVSTHPKVTLALIAFFNLILAKEYTGQIRALGSAVCAQGVFEPFQLEQFQLFQQRRVETLEVFVRHLTREQWDGWSELRKSAALHTFERLRSKLERLGQESVGSPPSALEWFRSATELIDAMRVYEVKLLGDLDKLCQLVFAEARSAWEDSQESQEDRDRFFLARLEHSHLRLHEERRDTRLADRGRQRVPEPRQETVEDLTAALTNDSVRAVEEASRWRKDLDRWRPLIDELAESSRRAKVLSLDASIEAVTPAEVAHGARELSRQLLALAEQLEHRVAELRSSADQSVDSFEALHADALKLNQNLLGFSDTPTNNTRM